MHVRSVTNAQLTYDLNLEKYKNGDLTGMDLNIYQNQLSQNKLSYTNSLISYKLELLNLKILTLYDFEKKQPVVPVKTLNNKKLIIYEKSLFIITSNCFRGHKLQKPDSES